MSQYKVGDWVVVTKHKINWANDMDSEVGKVVQITRLYEGFGGIVFEYEGYPKAYKFIAEHPKYTHCRPATPEEIALVTKVPTPKFKTGDKVVPHDKSTGCPFKDSDFKGYGAKYLIVIGISNPDGDIQTDIPERRGVEYYRPEDLTLYQEPTTIEEPSKELTELPKNWYIRVTPENKEMLGNWRKAGAVGEMNMATGIAHGYIHSDYDGEWHTTPYRYYTEITTEQFKKWVIGEDQLIVDSKTPEVTEVNKTHQHSVGDYFVTLEKNVHGISIDVGDIGRITKLESRDGSYGCEAPIGHDVWCLNDSVDNIKWFKTLEEATKFSESIKPIPVIEKPEVYKEAIYNAEDKHRGKRIIEFLISKGGINRNWEGNATDAWWYIDPNKHIDYGTSLPEGYTENTSFEAPKEQPVEELEFQEGAKEYKGICVHCRTQEQWDIVTKTMSIVWGSIGKWGMHRENTVIYHAQQSKQFSSLGYAKGNNYKVLSFEEWRIENTCVDANANETFPKASKVEGYSIDNSNPLFPKIKFN